MSNFFSRFFKKKQTSNSFLTASKEVEEFRLNRNIDRIHFNNFYNSKFCWNEFYSMKLSVGMIFYVDTTYNLEYVGFLEKRFEYIKNEMNEKNRNFIYNKEFDYKEFDYKEFDDLKYYYPFLKQKIEIANKSIESKALLNFVGYKGNIETGFLSINSAEMVFVGKKYGESFEEFIDSYLRLLAKYEKQSSRVFYSLGRNNQSINEPNITIDDETEKILEEIKNNLLRLKESGKFFIVAPQVEQIVKSFIKNENDFTYQLSRIIIYPDFTIKLPDYNIEIKLSHLTKAIYFLFLKHPEGIDLKMLKIHKKELMSIYQDISYQVSYDKMENSINDLVENENAIFVHLSRIKSAFLRSFTESYANFYYINGEKGQPKFIKLPNDKILFLK